MAACAAILAVVGAHPVRADGSQIAIEVTTNRESYLLGEWVRVGVRKCNPTSEAITVTHHCGGCHDTVEVLDAGGEVVSDAALGGILVFFDVTWQPGECTEEVYPWYQLAPVFQDGVPVGPGSYSVRHVWDFPTFATTTISPELVIAPDGPERAGGFIDFETLVDGSPAPGGPVGDWYLSRGVRFRELGYPLWQPVFATGYGSEDLFVHANVTSYPSGFNIVADFAAPVGHVEADVMTAAHESVTMSGFGADGQLVASVESASSADFWKGRLVLASPEGIVRVEWFPSVPQAGVGIDDLAFGAAPAVEVPALGAAGAAGLGLMLAAAGWGALRRRARQG